MVGVEANTNKTECVQRILYKAGHTHYLTRRIECQQEMNWQVF